METPEKIYIRRAWGGLAASQMNITGSDVEYTRTDTFIKKAVDWLTKNAENYIWYSDYAEYPGDDTCGMNDDFIDDFEKYMKGSEQ